MGSGMDGTATRGKLVLVIAGMLMTLHGLLQLALAEDWPQWRGPRRDGVWREEGIVESFPSNPLPLTWKVSLGPGYAGPAVAGNVVVVLDRQTIPQERERVLAFDAKTGKPLWTHAHACQYRGIGYTAGPRATPTIDGDLVYALGAMGHLHCLKLASGEVEWERDLDREYRISEPADGDTRMPIWGIASAPLIYEQLVILHVGGSDGACVVALDKRTGAEVWRALDDRAQYSAPVLAEQRGRPIVVVWTGDSVSGLAPETGEVLWRFPFPPVNMPIGIATPLVQGNRVFVTSFYDGSLMLELSQDEFTVREVWRGRGPSERQTEALHSIISTPVWVGDHIYGVDSYGELRCLEEETGNRVWENLTATPKARWSTIHFVEHENRHILFNERGELIIARLSPAGYEERSRARLLEPTEDQLRMRGGVCWSHPAYAQGHVFARNDKELVCADLRASGKLE